MNVFEAGVLANRIAKQFITSGIGLNEGIAKHAEERDLSRIQIQQLVSSCNHIANDYMRKTANDLTYKFDLADVDRVQSLLEDVSNDGVSVMKVAGALDSLVDFSNPELDAMQKVAAEGSPAEQERFAKEVKDRFRKIAARAALNQREAEAAKIASLNDLREGIEELTNQVKEYLTQTDYSYADIKKFASYVDTGDVNIMDPAFSRVESKLEKLGEPFRGKLAEGKELTKETFQRYGVDVPEPEVTVINGDVPLYRTLGRLATSAESASIKDRLTHDYSSLNSYAVTAEKEMPNTMAVQKDLIEELDSFYKGLCNCTEDATVEKLAGLVGLGMRFAGPIIRGGAKLFGMGNRGSKTLTGTSLTGYGGKVARNVATGAAAAQVMKGPANVANQARGGLTYGNKEGFNSGLGR